MSPNLDYTGHLSDAKKKRTYNQQLFQVVAPVYDRITPLLSWGHDAGWKRALVEGVPQSCRGVVVDIACGTGDITTLVASRYPQSRVVGIDLSREMVRIAVNRFPHLTFGVQDMSQLGLQSESAAVVTGGYALRNAPDLDPTLREIYRILKPGGYVAFLEFSKPSSKALQGLELGLLAFWGGLWGLVFHRNPRVYAYIAASLRTFPDRRTFRKKLEQNGFCNIRSRSVFLGFASLTWAEKISSRKDGNNPTVHGKIEK